MLWICVYCKYWIYMNKMNAINGIQGNCYLPKCLVVILCDAADMLCAEAIMPSCKSHLITPQFYVGIYDKKIISYLNDLKSMSVHKFFYLFVSFFVIILFYHEFKSSKRYATQAKILFQSISTHADTYRQIQSSWQTDKWTKNVRYSKN